MTNARPRRSGFSLIEILIVIALLALLAAIGVGAYLRVQAGAEVQATEGTLNKLNVGIMSKWKAVVDQATREAMANKIPNEIREYTKNGNGSLNLERARVVWTYMRLKNEFPTSIAELTTAPSTTGLVVNGYTMPKRTIFNSVTGGTPEEQSAALLYASLVKGGVGGTTFDADPLRNQTKQTATGIPYFVDTWGKPIIFLRMAFTPELDDVNQPYLPKSGINSKDPIDPKGTLTDPGNMGWSSLNNFWSIMTNGHYSYAEFQSTYPSRNWIASPISSGPDEEFGSLIVGPSGDPSGDNLVGFRLRKEGQRGD